MIFIVSKLVNAFLLPPGLFITLLFLGAIFLRQARKPLLALALFIWLLSSYIGAKTLVNPLEKMKFASSKKEPIAVVVLGGGRVSEEPYLALSRSGTKRLLWGLRIAIQKDLPLIYSGYENEYARKTLLTLIQTFHLPLRECDRLQKGCFVIEGKSKDTYENAKFTKELFSNFNIEVPSIILVTSAYHMPRSFALFRYYGFDIMPSKCDYLLDKFPSFWEILPRMDNLSASYAALHEYLGLLSLKLRGIK